MHVLNFLHQRFVDVQAAGCIENYDVMAVLLRIRQTGLTDLCRPFGGFFGVDINTELFTEALQLLHSGRALQVSSNQQRLLLLGLLKMQRELGAGRRLTTTLQTAHHQDQRPLVGHRQTSCLASEQIGQRIVKALDELLARVDRVNHVLADDALADVGNELLGDLEVDVSLQQGLTDGADTVVDIGFGQFLLTDDALVGIT